MPSQPTPKNSSKNSDEEPFEFQIAKDLLDSIPKLMARIRGEMRVMAKPQLTIAQLRILAKLNRNPSSISEMAEWQGVSAPAMSKMVVLLEKRQLLRRVVQSSDRRQVEISLTAEGREVFLSIRKAVREKMAVRIALLSDAKKQILFNAIEVLNEIYE